MPLAAAAIRWNSFPVRWSSWFFTSSSPTSSSPGAGVTDVAVADTEIYPYITSGILFCFVFKIYILITIDDMHEIIITICQAVSDNEIFTDLY